MSQLPGGGDADGVAIAAEMDVPRLLQHRRATRSYQPLHRQRTLCQKLTKVENWVQYKAIDCSVHSPSERKEGRKPNAELELKFTIDCTFADYIQVVTSNCFLSINQTSASIES
jgi:hypothetical protein